MDPEEEDEERKIKRILVAIDASPHSLAALQAAIDLAEQLQAELGGLFIEDIRLVNASNMPLARSVSVYSAVSTSMDREQMERELRSQGIRARLALETLARQAGVKVAFRTSRGLVTQELLQAALDVDLLVLGRTGWSRRRRLGSTARQVVISSPGNVLILPERMRLSVPLGVLYDGSDASARALDMGASLLEGFDNELKVIIISDLSEQARQMHGRIADQMMERNIQASYSWLVSPSVTQLAANLPAMIKRLNIHSLVMPASLGRLPAEVLMEFLEEIQIPVLLIR